MGRSLISSLTRSLWLLWTRLIEAKEKARSPVRRLGQDTRQEMGGGGQEHHEGAIEKVISDRTQDTF